MSSMLEVVTLYPLAELTETDQSSYLNPCKEYFFHVKHKLGRHFSLSDIKP